MLFLFFAAPFVSISDWRRERRMGLSAITDKVADYAAEKKEKEKKGNDYRFLKFHKAVKKPFGRLSIRHPDFLTDGETPERFEFQGDALREWRILS